MRTIAITGASSGLGRALALACAKPGVTLHLAGRNQARLDEVAATAHALGADASASRFDITDAAAAEAWVQGCGGLDLAIANAGISAGPGTANFETAAGVRAIVGANISGVFNTVLPAMALMAARAPDANGVRGRVAVVGSIAGLIALPTSPAYSASKAMLDMWVTATAPNVAKEGIRLTMVRPGFIRTPMTAKNPYKMPGLMDADQAAARILAGIAAGKSHITFPWWLAALARFGNMLPASLLAGMPKKPA
jgi:NAD(P)-dependent dehydrogenase (short-subunit alcohol dehydrogenase family)